jgi:hypothetical protein
MVGLAHTGVAKLNSILSIIFSAFLLTMVHVLLCEHSKVVSGRVSGWMDWGTNSSVERAA